MLARLPINGDIEKMYIRIHTAACYRNMQRISAATWMAIMSLSVSEIHLKTQYAD